MLFNEFERLVNRATGGFMLESEVSDVVQIGRASCRERV